MAGLGGLMCFTEGKRIKAVEGVPVEEEKLLGEVERDVEAGEGTKEGKKRERSLSHTERDSEKVETGVKGM